MHLSDEQLQRALHGELDASARETLMRHASECPQCAGALDAAAREEGSIFDLLRKLDHPAPAVDARSLIPPARPTRLAWGRRAAAVVVVAALAGAAYAIPGSPVRELVRRVAALISDRRDVAPAGAPLDTEPVMSGISVPMAERFAIHFTAEQDSGAAVLSWTEERRITVRARGGRPTFTTDAGRLTVENGGVAAHYEIDVPRDVYRFEVTVGSRSLFLKEGPGVSTSVELDAWGRMILPLTAPGASGE